MLELRFLVRWDAERQKIFENAKECALPVDFFLGRLSRQLVYHTASIYYSIVIRLTLGWLVDRSFTPVAQ